MIRYVIGDATRPQGAGDKIIAHVVNDAGGWGAGFTAAITTRWRWPEMRYRGRYAIFGPELGKVQYVMVESGDGTHLCVANMTAQHGYSAPGAPAIRYTALRECLHDVGTFALNNRCCVHMPRIGCGLAGGDWETVGPIVVSELCDRGIDVTVYDLA